MMERSEDNMDDLRTATLYDKSLFFAMLCNALGITKNANKQFVALSWVYDMIENGVCDAEGIIREAVKMEWK